MQQAHGSPTHKYALIQSAILRLSFKQQTQVILSDLGAILEQWTQHLNHPQGKYVTQNDAISMARCDRDPDHP